jgi:pyruvate/2-oxoglutarate dehydrogenase complex dihydrolipoamide acyltransferase (E2) component
VAVIETDKVNVDIRTTYAGVIKKFFAQEGDNVTVDSNFFEIDTDAKGGAAPAGKGAEKVRFIKNIVN